MLTHKLHLKISYHLKQDDRQDSTHGEEDSHYYHDGSHCFVVNDDIESSDPTTGINNIS